MPRILVYPHLSPRLVLVQDPDTQLTMQELVDLANDWEGIPANGAYPHLLRADGKVDLGGGVYTGITVTGLNTVFGFDQRPTVISTGTCTTANADGARLYDSAGSFQTDGVEPGAWVLNEDDLSVGTVLSVEGEDWLTMLPLGGGTDNQWEIGDSYRIWNVVQVEFIQGNLGALDSDGDPIGPVFPTALTQVARTASASATLQELEAIQFASFQNAVWVDVDNGGVGTDYPMGTREYPVDNMSDAKEIADSRGFATFCLLGDLALGAGDVFSGYTFEGENTLRTTLTVDGAADVQNCEFRDVRVTGVLNGDSVCHGCLISTLVYVSGEIYRCAIEGTLTLGGLSQANLFDCWSNVPGTATPIINMGGSGRSLGVRNYNGGLKLINKDGADDVILDVNSGNIILDSTVTAGTIVVRGVGTLTDNSIGATVVSTGLISPDSVADAVMEEQTSEHTTPGSVGRLLGTLEKAVTGVVYIDVDNGVSGTGEGVGTRSNPVDNIADAFTIATALGARSFWIRGDLTLDRTVTDWRFEGVSSRGASLALANYDVGGCFFKGLALSGNGGGGDIHASKCSLGALSNITGEFVECGLTSTLTPADGERTTLIKCFSDVLASSPPIIDLTAQTGDNLQVRVYSGDLELRNADNAGQQLTVGVAGGRLVLHSSCTAGDLILTGMGELDDSSDGLAIDKRGFLGLGTDIPAGYEYMADILFKAFVAALNAGA